jgi:ketosteroid isomerase-like protein
VAQILVAVIPLIAFIVVRCNMSSSSNRQSDLEAITKAVHTSIEWATPNKDFESLYAVMAQDSNLFIYHPNSTSTVIGFPAFKEMTEGLFMNPKFKATGSDIRDLRITISDGGDVAWYACILDDFGEFDGRPYAWKNTRWTGVLEKRDGRWQIVQMHFSFASDAKSDDAESGDQQG